MPTDTAELSGNKRDANTPTNTNTAASSLTQILQNNNNNNNNNNNTTSPSGLSILPRVLSAPGVIKRLGLRVIEWLEKGAVQTLTQQDDDGGTGEELADSDPIEELRRVYTVLLSDCGVYHPPGGAENDPELSASSATTAGSSSSKSKSNSTSTSTSTLSSSSAPSSSKKNERHHHRPTEAEKKALRLYVSSSTTHKILLECLFVIGVVRQVVFKQSILNSTSCSSSSSSSSSYASTASSSLLDRVRVGSEVVRKLDATIIQYTPARGIWDHVNKDSDSKDSSSFSSSSSSSDPFDTLVSPSSLVLLDPTNSNRNRNTPSDITNNTQHNVNLVATSSSSSPELAALINLVVEGINGGVEKVVKFVENPPPPPPTPTPTPTPTPSSYPDSDSSSDSDEPSQLNSHSHSHSYSHSHSPQIHSGSSPSDLPWVRRLRGMEAIRLLLERFLTQNQMDLVSTGGIRTLGELAESKPDIMNEAQSKSILNVLEGVEHECVKRWTKSQSQSQSPNPQKEKRRNSNSAHPSPPPPPPPLPIPKFYSLQSTLLEIIYPALRRAVLVASSFALGDLRQTPFWFVQAAMKNLEKINNLVSSYVVSTSTGQRGTGGHSGHNLSNPVKISVPVGGSSRGSSARRGGSANTISFLGGELHHSGINTHTSSQSSAASLTKPANEAMQVSGKVASFVEVYANACSF